MNAPFFLSWRYQRGKKSRLVSLISWFSSIGVALGVAVLIIGLSAVNGFERELNQRVLAVVPQVEIKGYAPLSTASQLQRLVQQDSAVVASMPFISLTAMVENGEALSLVQLRAIEPAQYERVSALPQFIPAKQWAAFQREGGLILGAGIAQKLGVKQGDEVSILLPSPSEDGQLSQPERFSLTVTGILRLDGQLDHSYALMDLRTAQQWLGYEADQISGMELRVRDPFAVQSLTFPTLQNYPEPLYAQHWISQFGRMYQDIMLIRLVMYIAMVLVIGVACFNIISTLIMAVKEKQNDIAILRTIGANQGFIRRIFLYYGMISGMKGCLFGLTLGSLIALNLTLIMRGLEQLFGFKLLSGGVYFIDFLPSEWHWQDVLIVLIATLFISLAASFYPAQRAAKLDPAQILSGR